MWRGRLPLRSCASKIRAAWKWLRPAPVAVDFEQVLQQSVQVKSSTKEELHINIGPIDTTQLEANMQTAREALNKFAESISISDLSGAFARMGMAFGQSTLQMRERVEALAAQETAAAREARLRQALAEAYALQDIASARELTEILNLKFGEHVEESPPVEDVEDETPEPEPVRLIRFRGDE